MVNSTYRPTPTVIEAATRLYERHDVRELSHRHAHNLDSTTDLLLREIDDARRFGRRTICFVTGIPGAGKTLTGLNVVHSRGSQQSSERAFTLNRYRVLLTRARKALSSGCLEVTPTTQHAIQRDLTVCMIRYSRPEFQIWIPPKLHLVCSPPVRPLTPLITDCWRG